MQMLLHKKSLPRLTEAGKYTGFLLLKVQSTVCESHVEQQQILAILLVIEN